MTLRSAQQELLLQLKRLYDEREAAVITDWVMEDLTGKKKTARLVDQQQELSEKEQQWLTQITNELLTHKPVQYVLGEAWFAGMKFEVDESVLIPRPETEELVNWIVEEISGCAFPVASLLDIGTGSGCIPVVVKKKLPKLSVLSVDISEEALQLAETNADTLEADIDLLHIDFLYENNWHQLSVFDRIVSNPPYIRQSEADTMSKHVLDFEPSVALFVPDEDALLFYRKIAVFAKEHLAENGVIFLEINEALAKEVIELYNSLGYRVELKKDLQGKDRMIKASFTPSE